MALLAEGMAHFSTLLLFEQVKGEVARIEFTKRLEERYGNLRRVLRRRLPSTLCWIGQQSAETRNFNYFETVWSPIPPSGKTVERGPFKRLALMIFLKKRSYHVDEHLDIEKHSRGSLAGDDHAARSCNGSKA